MVVTLKQLALLENSGREKIPTKKPIVGLFSNKWLENLRGTRARYGLSV